MAKRPKKSRMKPGPSRGGGMMDKIKLLQEQVMATQEALKEEIVSASAGGGAVTISITGDQICTSIEISPELLEDGDVEMLQDLLLTTLNSALDKSRELAAERLGPLTGGLPF